MSFTIISFYDDEGRARYPLLISKNNFPIQIDLLYWSGHYAWIKDFSRFMGDITAHKAKKFFCRKCLGHFSDELRMQEHSKYCIGTEGRHKVQLADDRKSLKRRAQEAASSICLTPAPPASNFPSEMITEDGTQFSADDPMNFDRATVCYLCHKPFGDSSRMKKVIDYDHSTGRFQGAAHSYCNIQLRKAYKFPIFLHNCIR